MIKRKRHKADSYSSKICCSYCILFIFLCICYVSTIILPFWRPCVSSLLSSSLPSRYTIIIEWVKKNSGAHHCWGLNTISQPPKYFTLWDMYFCHHIYFRVSTCANNVHANIASLCFVCRVEWICASEVSSTYNKQICCLCLGCLVWLTQIKIGLFFIYQQITCQNQKKTSVFVCSSDYYEDFN